MKRELLRKLGIDKETENKIMAERENDRVELPCTRVPPKLTSFSSSNKRTPKCPNGSHPAILNPVAMATLDWMIAHIKALFVNSDLKKGKRSCKPEKFLTFGETKKSAEADPDEFEEDW